MEIQRIDIYDFKVIFNHQEFMKIRRFADDNGYSIEEVLHSVLKNSFTNDSDNID